MSCSLGAIPNLRLFDLVSYVIDLIRYRDPFFELNEPIELRRSEIVTGKLDSSLALNTDPFLRCIAAQRNP